MGRILLGHATKRNQSLDFLSLPHVGSLSDHYLSAKACLLSQTKSSRFIHSPHPHPLIFRQTPAFLQKKSCGLEYQIPSSQRWRHVKLRLHPSSYQLLPRRSRNLHVPHHLLCLFFLFWSTWCDPTMRGSWAYSAKLHSSASYNATPNAEAMIGCWRH